MYMYMYVHVHVHTYNYTCTVCTHSLHVNDSIGARPMYVYCTVVFVPV